MANYFQKLRHPRNDINIKDESQTTAVQQVIRPLHRPFFAIFAAKGESTIQWHTGSSYLEEYGDSTFNKTSPYYRPEAFYLKNLFTKQGAYVYRIIPEDAKKATFVLEGHLSKNVQVPQWKRDEKGNLAYDENGNLIPELDSSNAQITLPGVKIKYMLRELSENEDYDTVQEKLVSIGDESYTVYPVAAGEYVNAGEAGSKSGFRFYFDYSLQNTSITDAVGAILFNFTPIEQPYNNDSPVIVRDINSNPYVQFAAKPNAYDKETDRTISPNETMIRAYYSKLKGKNTLPYNIHFYTENMQILGKAIKDVEATNTELTSEWMVDFLSCRDLKGRPYKCAVLDESGIKLTGVSTHYLSGGKDGDISNESYEKYYQQLLFFDLFPELEDYHHYRITHLYDVGYSMETKLAMASFMGTHKRCKIIGAAQNITRPLYNADESISAATALRARMLLTPESELYGTGALRGEVFGQAGYLNDTSVEFIVPLTYWSMMKRAEYQNSSVLKGTVKKRPNAEVVDWRHINYVPFNAEQKELNWDGGINYCEYANDNTIYFADVRSIYDDDSSVFSDTTFTDCAIFLMYIIDEVHTLFAGDDSPFSEFSDAVKKAIESRAYKSFGSKYSVTCRVYQTAEDYGLGSSFHTESIMIGYRSSRVWKSDIIGRRETVTISE